LPVSASQTRAVPSSEAVTTRRPSGLNTAERTESSCCKGRPTGLPVSASQTRAVWSSEAVTTRRPSGLNPANVTAPWCLSSAAGNHHLSCENRLVIQLRAGTESWSSCNACARRAIACRLLLPRRITTSSTDDRPRATFS